MKNKKVETTPRDFFLNLFSMIALYVSATSFATLIFQYINNIFPDPLEYISVNSGAIRFAIASLVILFPAYIWSVLFMQKDYQRNPERKEVAIRKWLIYFTLFATSLIVIGDFVALLMKFLEGELTIRFFLKIITIIFVAGIVFGYYLWDLKQRKDRGVAKTFVYVICTLVTIAIVASFFVIGSPAEQRRRLFDEERVSDMQFLQSEIIFFWQAKDRLPESLNEIENDVRGVVAPVDPLTGDAYRYRVLSDLLFELCAMFDTESVGKDMYQGRAVPFPFPQVDWSHGPGLTCFERNIDPDIFNQKSARFPL